MTDELCFLQEAKEARQAYELGASIEGLRIEYGVSYDVMRLVLIDSGATIRRRRGGEWSTDLSPPQLQCLILVSHGLTNGQIATTLECSDDAVKNLLKQVFVKLRAQNRAHAVRVGFEKGLLPEAARAASVDVEPVERT